MSRVLDVVSRFARDDEGASASEYAILVAVVVVVVYAAVKIFDLNGIFTAVVNRTTNCINGTGSTC